MPPSGLAIDLHDVTKVYKGRVRALDGVKMQVQRGEIFGLLGPNGAGKSTLVKIIMSVVRPTAATGAVLDQPVGSQASLRRVGYLPEHHRFPRYLTGRQTLEFFAMLSGMEKRARRKRTSELLETVGMTNWADSRVGTYSKGMMQRVGVAAAMVNDPDLIILDEPTDGVDPVGRREIREVLAQFKTQGRTVFVNSHLLSELELICDRVAILVAGRVVSQGTLHELTIGRQFFELEVAADPARLLGVAETRLAARWAGPPSAQGLLKGAISSGLRVELQGPLIRIETTDLEAAQIVIDAVRAEGLPLKRWQAIRPSLEDLFIEAVGGIAGGHNAGASKLRTEGRP